MGGSRRECAAEYREEASGRTGETGKKPHKKTFFHINPVLRWRAVHLQSINSEDAASRMFLPP